MYINLNDKEVEILRSEEYGKKILFSYRGKKYYFKISKSLDSIYNELIACKIAKKMNLPCCEYYPAEHNGFVGVASEYYEDKKAITMEEYLKSKFGSNIHIHNNLTELTACFYTDFSEEVALRLTTELTNIFIFDAIIGNSDRNSTNYMIIIDGENTRLAPVFDNENMLDDHAIYDGDYSLGVDERDYNDGDKFNVLYKFLDRADDETFNRFVAALRLISNDSITEIFDEISKDTIVVEPIKEIVVRRMAMNKKMIDNYLNSNRRKTYKQKSIKVCYN